MMKPLLALLQALLANFPQYGAPQIDSQPQKLQDQWRHRE